jgi:hypothetical protein
LKNNNNNRSLKVLLDENLSPYIISNFKKQFVDYSHVYFENLKSASDIDIWDYAQANGFDVIVTIDSDFKDIAEVKALEVLASSRQKGPPDLSTQPFVIHVSRVDGDHGRVARTFNQHASPLIREIIKKPRHNAYLEMKGDKFFGKNIKDIFNRYASGSIRAQGKLIEYEPAHLNQQMVNKKRKSVGLPEL